MEYIRVLNWNKYQHYARDNPPWIKLYVRNSEGKRKGLIKDFAFLRLPVPARLLLILVWMLYASYNKVVPKCEKWLKSELHWPRKPDLKPLISAGFIEVYECDPKKVEEFQAQYHARNVRADGSEVKSKVAPQRTENREQSKKSNTKENQQVVEQIYQAYPRKVGKRAAIPAIQRALERCQYGHDWMLARVQRYADSPAGKAGRFTPHPATWFNDGRYDDDQKEWQVQSKEQLASRVPVKDGQYAGMGENIDA